MSPTYPDDDADLLPPDDGADEPWLPPTLPVPEAIVAEEARVAEMTLEEFHRWLEEGSEPLGFGGV
jgi:hypothetical protein